MTAGAQPMFRPGDRVQVRADEPPHHCRTPYFLRGRRGTVEDLLGVFRNPETLAYHKPGLPRKALYRVRFAQSDLWPGYKGSLVDSLVADLYEHWLIADSR